MLTAKSCLSFRERGDLVKLRNKDICGSKISILITRYPDIWTLLKWFLLVELSHFDCLIILLTKSVVYPD